MGRKKQTCLYLDSELMLSVQAMGINISEFCQNCLLELVENDRLKTLRIEMEMEKSKSIRKVVDKILDRKQETDIQKSITEKEESDSKIRDNAILKSLKARVGNNARLKLAIEEDIHGDSWDYVEQAMSLISKETGYEVQYCDLKKLYSQVEA